MKRLPWFVKRNTFTTLALVAGLSLGVQAAQAEPSQHHSTRWDYIFTQLDITEEQQAQVHTLFKEIAAERREKMKAQREERKRYYHVNEHANEGQHEDRSARRDAWQAKREVRREQARQNLQDRLGTILAPDQVEGFITYLDAHKHQHRTTSHFNKHGKHTRGHRHGRLN